MVRRSTVDLVEAEALSPDAGIAFEYELPREGGRRPDVVIVTPTDVVVLEFKQKDHAGVADIDQVAAYARDLANYHSGCREQSVLPVLVPTRRTGADEKRDGVWVTTGEGLSNRIRSLLAEDGVDGVDIKRWIEAEYMPLPTLVEAARLVFEREPLPNIRRAHSAGIPDVVNYLHSVVEEASKGEERHLVLVTGVPGAGKTLVGIQFVYSRTLTSNDTTNAGVLLSGNGPLVEVLRYTLHSKTFIQDIRNFRREYAVRGKIPHEHVIVFDEAQRAWDVERMETENLLVSEPEFLLDAAGRTPGWAVVVGLIGSGQEIHHGEEAGLPQWNEALQAVGDRGADWIVHVPEALEREFTHSTSVRRREHLALSSSLRTHLALDVQIWIEQLLVADLDECQRLSCGIRAQGFNLHLTRDLDTAKAYARARYADHPGKRFGLVASSKAANLPVYGVPNSFQALKRLKKGPWFVDAPSSPNSCCQLRTVATEFECQGLELDLPIVCWGDDMWMQDGQWRSKLLPRKAHDPKRLRLNSYRVLLSRGRDGLVIWVPPEASLTETYDTLANAGAMVMDA